MNENTAIVLLEAIFHSYSCAYAERPGNNHCVIRGDSSGRLVGSLTLTPTLTLEQLDYKKCSIFSAWQNGASIKDDISGAQAELKRHGRCACFMEAADAAQRGSRQNSFHLTVLILSAVYSLTSAFFQKSWTLPFSLPPSAARWRRQR